MNLGLIPGGQNLSKRKDGILHVCGSYGQGTSRSDAPRLAWYKQKTWKERQNTVYWVDIKLAQKKGFKFYQTRSNAIILYNTLPAYCIPKVVVMESGETIYEKVYASPRPPPKISFEDNWMKELVSEVAGGAEDSQQTQQKTQNPIVRTGRLLLAEQQSGSSVQEIDKRVLLGCESTNERTGRLAFQLCASVC